MGGWALVILGISLASYISVGERGGREREREKREREREREREGEGGRGWVAAYDFPFFCDQSQQLNVYLSLQFGGVIYSFVTTAGPQSCGEGGRRLVVYSPTLSMLV